MDKVREMYAQTISQTVEEVKNRLRDVHSALIGEDRFAAERAKLDTAIVLCANVDDFVAKMINEKE